MNKKKFIESGRQHFFVMYILSPVLLTVLINNYYFNNIAFSILLTIVILFFYHELVGYRFHQKLTFYNESFDIGYSKLIWNNKKKTIKYDNIIKIIVNDGYGATQPFIKIRERGMRVKFIVDDWDLIDITYNLWGKCSHSIFDFENGEVIENEIMKRNN